MRISGIDNYISKMKGECDGVKYEEEQPTLRGVKMEATTHYEKGGHFIIECWSDDDIINWINEGNSYNDLFDIFKINNHF